MPDDFQQIIQYCSDLEQQYAGYKKNCQDIDRMYLMDWQDKPNNANLKFTVSPSARNAALGAIRLMGVAEPVFSVPFNKTDLQQKEKSEMMEQSGGAMWYRSGRVHGTPVQTDAVESAILYSQVQIAITKTEDLVKQATGGLPAAQKRFERIAKRTPILFEVLDPKSGFPDFDRFGLRAYYRKVKTTTGAVLDQWGAQGKKILGDTTSRFDSVDYCDYWDFEYHYAWIDGKTDPLLEEAHNLPCIPIVCQTTEGSSLHEKKEHAIQPFLYTLLKSGLWERQNLELTLLYSLMFWIGANPTFVATVKDPENSNLGYDGSVPGGVIKMSVGESFGPLAKNAIDPSLITGMQIADQLVEESTIYKQALGQPLAGNPTYSSVALLTQGGRLSLANHQKRGGWGVGAAMETAFELLREGGGKVQDMKGSVMDIKASNIPEQVFIEATLDVTLPQDLLQNANIGQMIANSKLMPRRWVRENILKEGQSDQITKEIWTEETEDLYYQLMQAQYLPRIKAMIDQAMQGGGVGMGGPVPGGMPGAAPGGPDAGAMMSGQPVPAGAPTEGGLPQAMAGMTPAGGPMNGGLPPEGMGGMQ